MILCFGHYSCSNEVSLCCDTEKSINFVKQAWRLFYVLFLLHQSPKPDTKNVLASPREFATHNLKKQEVNDAAMGGRVGGAVAE